MSLDRFDPLSLALLLAALSLLPLLLVCTTCFLKVSMVLIIVRNAIGVQQVPPTIAVYAIAMAITMLVMAPVANEMYASVVRDGDATRRFTVDDLPALAKPLRRFMLEHTLPERRERMLAIARSQWPSTASAPKDSDFAVLVPSFVVSEMELAFEVGLVLYVPFVVIDLLLSNLLLALGMQMVSPMVVSLPLKMLLFVLLDGWTKLVEGLVASYQ